MARGRDAADVAITTTFGRIFPPAFSGIPLENEGIRLLIV
jgi:hypothetical protein